MSLLQKGEKSNHGDTSIKMKGNSVTPCLRGETSGFLQWSQQCKGIAFQTKKAYSDKKKESG
jgi:hypothetical protein